MTEPIPQTGEAVAMTTDRAFFERHPDAGRYLRRRIPGEFAPHEHKAPLGAFPFVKVTQRAPGSRTRQPFAHLEILSMS